MKYTEFEKQVVNTFNRMHIVYLCDAGFITEGAEWDVQSIIAKSFKEMFHIESVQGKGYVVKRTVLMDMFLDDLDEFLLEALNSFNGMMDKYNVVPDNAEICPACTLHII